MASPNKNRVPSPSIALVYPSPRSSSSSRIISSLRPQSADGRQSAASLRSTSADPRIRVRRSTLDPEQRPSSQPARMPTPSLASSYNGFDSPQARNVHFNIYQPPGEGSSYHWTEFKADGYQYSEKARWFVCGVNMSKYGRCALEYTIENLVDANDGIVCLRVIDPESDEAKATLTQEMFNERGTALSSHVQEVFRDCKAKAVKVVSCLSIADLGTAFDYMVKNYNPTSIVIGTRGRSIAEAHLGKSSISDFLYQHCPVPVTIVRMDKKRRKNFERRARKPEHKKYRLFLDEDENLINEPNGANQGPQIIEGERENVARIIGIPDDIDRLEQYLDASRSRAASREPIPMSAVSSDDDDSDNEGDEDGTSTDEDDEIGAAPLSRTSSLGSNTLPGYVTHKDDVGDLDHLQESHGLEFEPRKRFEEMDNYDAVLAEHEEHQTAAAAVPGESASSNNEGAPTRTEQSDHRGPAKRAKEIDESQKQTAEKSEV